MSERRFADAYELTPVQQGMLFHAQLDPAAGLYLVQVWTPLAGPLDPAAFEAAWRWAVARHPALRTGFVSEGMSRPMQVVHPRAELPWAALDWRGLPADEVDERREALLAEDRARGFDLAAPPLVRLTLARLAEEEHTLLWTLHHLVLDGWSHTQVLREVLARYAAARADTAYDPPAPRPYRDYVAWLRARDAAADEAFWRAALEGVREPTPLGIDSAAPGSADGQGVNTLRLSPEVSTGLRERARALRVTQNTLFQGAWALVLSRYAGVDDVLFGATTAGRPESLAGAGEMVGLFVNTLPVRAMVSPQAELGAWLTALQARQAAAREHEHAALVDVQGWTEVPRGRPLYESVLAFESFPRVEGAGAETGGLSVGRLSGISRTGYPLTLVVHPGDEAVLRCYHERGRIPDGAAGRVLGHLATVLAAFAAAPAETRLGEIEILTAGERETLLRWGTGAEGLAEAKSIPELLAVQVAARPDAVAAEFADGAMTYRELDARANRVARRLAALGVRPGDHVGLAAGQTCAMVAALAGILRAGAAAVPLDPEYPAERLAFMLADTEARALVTRGGALDGIASPTPVLDLERDTAAIDAEDPSPVDASGPESIAYVIYTSGSTGRPKGVRVPHRAIVRTVVGTDHAEFGPGTRTAQQANLSFDASVWEIWGALLNGGTVVGIERDLLLSADYPAALRKRRITDLFITAQLFNRHVRETPDAFATVGTVLAGGEALDPAAMRACLEGGPPRRLLNGYGPTECTVFAATHVIDAVAADARGIPIGRPIAATTCRVLDERGAPVPAGVAGELCIGGGRVAVGYLRRPELTAEKFVPDPFAPGPDARMYRTGDRVRWNEGGTIEFLGRLDGQVKVRGFRVELGEIGSVLRDDARVADAAAVVREDVPGERRLVAYVVAREGESVDAAALRQALAVRLPEYMLPSAIVVLDALPLNRNGKVDRQALPAPEAPSTEGEAVAPRDVVEALLAELWADVLGAAPGVHVSFFEAGGHSLQAMQLATRIRQALRVELPLRALFEAPTVAGLAARVRADAETAARAERTAQAARLVRRMNDAQIRGFLADAAGEVRGKTEAARRVEMVDYLLGRDAATPEDAPIVPRETEGPAPLSSAQERLWVLDQMEPGGPAYAIPAALRLRGPLDADALRRALAEIVRRHDALRTTFASSDGQPVQVVASEAELDFDTVDLSAGDAEEREDALAAYTSAEAARAFDLGAGPLFRARLARLGDGEHVLLIVVHHAVADGWSLAVLYRELSALYAAFRRGEPSPLQPLAVQYADFADWQRGWLASPRIERQVEW
ncbi:MAG TPA: amino acid adenylation domain-containing protein, partial [Longimicrobium sp.]|nr:amino acid adenylation domain-containing protein [Longimicrobium sp.]